MNRSYIAIVVVTLFAITSVFTPQFNSATINESDDLINPIYKNKEDLRAPFSIADSSTNGILNPLTIEQVGYTPSGTITARTDTSYNTAYSMYLDDGHNWLGSMAEIDVRDLTRLYLLNGTFSEGTAAGDTIAPSSTPDFYPYGWGANSTSGNVDQVQRVRYEDTGREYVLVENKAKLTNNPQHIYTHYPGTSVIWNQTLDIDSTTDFTLSFGYLYASGPLDGTGPDVVPSNAYVDVTINGAVVYSISLIDLTQRDYWYSTGDIPLSLGLGVGQYPFHIGITLNESLVLDADFDYDSIPGADGSSNAEFITVLFDDVSFVAANPPDFEQVDLQFTVEGTNTPILGSSGVGTASIPEPAYWTVHPVDMQITSNTTVSFEYEAYLRSHRFSNSTWHTVITDEGAQYTVNLGESPQIQFQTYIGFLGDYENLTTKAWFPSDWENMTVRDPFLTDVTSSCSVDVDHVEIPTSLMSQLGWWTFTLESPNYLESIEIQKLNPTFDTWSADTEYRSGNTSRAAIDIGTATETPVPLDLVNVTWHLPNGTVWESDSDSGGIAGTINSTSHTFGSINTSAGLWLTCVSWHNGSEIAFGSTTFEVHHTTNLSPHEAYVELESGDSFTNFVYFTDSENGEYLLDPAATVTANWSVSTVPFGPDAVYNRWTGSFDTSLIGPGDNLIIVTANLQYYDEATCTFVVHTSFSNNELIIDNLPTGVGLGDTFLVTFQYLDQYGTGIPDANVGVTFTGPTDGLSWLTPVNVVDGNYSVAFTAEHSGSYAITISAAKALYEVAEDTLFVLVGEISTTFTMENGSAAVIRYGEDYRLVVRYVNGTGHGLDSASVAVASMTPSTGLDTSATTPLGNGYFSILLTPQETNTFTLLLNASLQDHVAGFKSFTITATTIGAQLTAEQSSEVITTDQSCIVTLNLTSELYGQLVGATVLPYNPPSGLSFSAVTPLGGGLYTVTISSTMPDSYQIVFIAYAANHNDATTSIPLGVIVTPTHLRISDGLPSASVEFSQEYDLLVFFERTITPSNITGATIQVNFTSFETLDWVVIPLADGYIIRFTTDQVGRWDFTVIASKTDFQPDDFEFTLFVNEIGTDLSGFSPSEPLSFGQTFSYTFHYYLLGNQSAGISGAGVIATGSGSDWFTIAELGNGYYNITVETQGLGRRVVELTFQKTGYQQRSAPFDLLVNPTLVVIDVQSIYWDQFLNVSLTLYLTESGTGNIITNATVTYALYYDSVEEVSGIMEEVSPGQYAATFSSTWRPGNGFDMRVFVTKENHALAGEFHSINVVPVPDPVKEWELYLATVVPQIGAVIALAAVAIVSQVVYSRKKKAQLEIDLSNKRRFDDADNIIGVIVMHKSSGIPIYSRIVKGGFEEGIVAAFISAVTHFREEFDAVDVEAMTVIPISDIIRAVQTRNLICAFITLRSASMDHNRKMESFGQQVATYLDDFYTESRPTSSLDSRITEIIDYVFDETMDGDLIKFYKAGSEKQFPRHLKFVEQLLEEIDSRHCSRPVYLARGVATYGVSEARGCTLVLEAMEKGIITKCEEHEPSIEDMEFKDFFEKKNQKGED